MLFPKQIKYTKQFKGVLKKKTNRGNKILFGTYGLKTLESARITSKQIEAGRRAIMRKMKRLGFLWVRVYPDTPVTAKPTEIRMGKGKGAVRHWVAKVSQGQILYEISGVSSEIALKAFKAGNHKLPVITKFVSQQKI